MHAVQLLASAARTATQSITTDPNGNPLEMKGGMGVKVVVDMTAVPTVETVTPVVEWQDPISQKWIAAITGAAIVAVSTVELTVYPGITVAANVAVAGRIPAQARLRVRFTHSASGSFTYSAALFVLP